MNKVSFYMDLFNIQESIDTHFVVYEVSVSLCKHFEIKVKKYMKYVIWIHAFNSRLSFFSLYFLCAVKMCVVVWHRYEFGLFRKVEIMWVPVKKFRQVKEKEMECGAEVCSVV